MFRKTILPAVTTAILATSMATTFPAAVSAAPAVSFTIDQSMQSKLNTMQWTMKAGTDGRPILSGNQYRLFNAVSLSGIKREKRSVAANLGWLSPTSDAFNVRIKRQAGDGQVRYGDMVALEVKSYGWLRYKDQSRGINLSDDDNTPHYMWKITGGTTGTKLVAGMPFALYNTRVNAEMTHCVRTWGIDLGWAGKSECGGRMAKLSNKVFGRNGLFDGDGLSGKAGALLKDHICETAVVAAAAGITTVSAGTGAALAPAAVIAIDECKKL